MEGIIDVNFWARIKFYSSKWLWEKSSLGSAIILDILVLKNERFTKKGQKWRLPSKIFNFWAWITFYSSKWSWEKSSLGSAIILDTLVMKNKSLTKKISSIFNFEYVNEVWMSGVIFINGWRSFQPGYKLGVGCKITTGNLNVGSAFHLEFVLESVKITSINWNPAWTIWHFQLWSFQGRDTKLERFLTKNQLYSNEITKFWELE